MADLTKTITALLKAGVVDEVRLEVVLKPKPTPPAQDQSTPTITMIIGPSDDEV